VTCQIYSDDVIKAVAADADNGSMELCAGEAESQSITVRVRSTCRRETVVQRARLVAERVRHTVCTAPTTHALSHRPSQGWQKGAIATSKMPQNTF